MGWNAQDIEKLRKGQNKQTAAHMTQAASYTAAPRSAAQSTGAGWTAEDVAALRRSTGTKKTTEAWENRGAGTSARKNETNGTKAGTNNARIGSTGSSLSGQVLAQMMDSTGSTRSTNSKLQLAVPQAKQNTQAYPGKNGIVSGQNTTRTTPLRGGTAQPEWLTKAQPQNQKKEQTTAPAARVTGTVQPTEQQRIAGIADGKEGLYAQTAQNLKKSFEPDSQTDRFDELNQWMDADPRHQQLVSLMRQGKSGMEDAAALGSSTGDRAVATREELQPGRTAEDGLHGTRDQRSTKVHHRL